MDELNKYLRDKKFFEWVFYPTKELNDFWNLYLLDNPEEKTTINKAYRILSQFRTHDKKLGKQERITLFLDILERIETADKRKKLKAIVISVTRYAAIAFIFFALGSILFYEKNNFDPKVYSENYLEVGQGNVSKIIRGNGENIVLAKDKSSVEYKKTGALIINKLDTLEIEQEKELQSKRSQLVVPYGKTSDIVLQDGTKVYLNAGSRLIYPEFFGGKKREVFLVGEGYFEVAHNKDQPFIVHSNDISIQVLGTRFNVSAYPSDDVTETVLVDGRVSLTPNLSGLFSKSIELETNQLASYDKKTGKTLLKEVDTDYYTLWKDGLFKFESTDLSRVVRKLERFYNIRLTFEDPLIGSLRISGKLELKQDCIAILDIISSTASVKIDKAQDNSFIIYR